MHCLPCYTIAMAIKSCNRCNSKIHSHNRTLKCDICLMVYHVRCVPLMSDLDALSDYWYAEQLLLVADLDGQLCTPFEINDEADHLHENIDPDQNFYNELTLPSNRSKYFTDKLLTKLSIRMNKYVMGKTSLYLYFM
jgi:hypothetical protein